MIKITVERDSICMGDDCFAPHGKTYILRDNAACIDLFKRLKKDKYFPSVSGNNAVWVMTNESFDCIFSYFTATDKFSMGTTEKNLKTICAKTKKLRFKFYSSPQKWKEHIYRMYDNNEYALWRDGWRDETDYCDSLMNL
ncbi:MAG: hypothetical protein IJP10_05655 [Clostridia bacterium]|nr:hypothetical protein [Clostridia bacterium]